MAVKHQTTEEIGTSVWKPWESMPNGTWSHERIVNSHMVFIAHEIRKLNETMTLFRQDMLSLGRDGLHDVIKAEARRVREAKRKRLARNRARRQAGKGGV
jgi:hypothetical protein